MQYESDSQSRPWELQHADDGAVLVRFFNTVYAWMAVGIAWTAVVAYYVAHTPALLPSPKTDGAPTSPQNTTTKSVSA